MKLEMLCSSGGGRTLSQFALVSYIPGPLGRFLDRLRLELTPDCHPNAHVTVLPPRPVVAELKEAVEHLVEDSALFPPFDIELGDIDVFPISSVIYLSVRRGEHEIRALHEILNSGPVRFDCSFPYHPHVTIAQDFPPERLEELARLARQRWAEYHGSRKFTVERLAFVQNVAPLTWVDVARVRLAVPVPAGR